MKYLDDIDVKGKRVLYRVDINCGIRDGALLDDTRLRSIIPTVEQLRSSGAKQVIFLAHQGRGKERSPETVLDLHAQRLEELLNEKVLKFDSCRDLEIPEDAPFVLLENVRLDDEADKDEGKREVFAKILASYGDVYVNDAFAACHRDHASMSSLPKLMEVKAAGLLLQKEIEALKPLLEGQIEQPLTVVIGGAKIDTKIGLIRQFMDSGARFLLGGGIANTFLAAEGYDVGESLMQEDKLELAQELALTLDSDDEERLLLPTDVICADEISETATAIDIPVEDVMGDMKILDAGKQTSDRYAEVISQSKTVLWNGPLGLIEYPAFREGSASIARALAVSNATTIIGGGESVSVINMLKIPHGEFTHVSTGGGAMLEYLSGEELPGLAALG